jgi:hypothetical protein
VRAHLRPLTVCLAALLAPLGAGCSLITEFDESKIPGDDTGASGDTDVDSTPPDTSIDVAETAPDSSPETTAEASPDAADDALDSAPADGADAADETSPDAADAADATDAADAETIDDGAVDASEAGDGSAEADAADAPETCVALTCALLATTCGSKSDGCGATLNCNDGVKDGTETDVDCGGGATSCANRCGNGKTCLIDGDCTSGHCVDGVCCDSACNGQCEACNLTGTVGACTQVVGAPRGGRTACGGAGSCAGSCVAGNRTTCTFPTTSCRAASCTAGTATASASCDGAGACPAASTSSCGAYQCDGTGNACRTSCAADAECASGYACVGSACVAGKSLGATCTTNGECANGHCVDGVCCNAACTGQCQACDVAGKVGTCSNVTGATHGGRAACTGTGICAGNCDGTGAACAYPSSSTTCAAASCSGGTAHSTASCDGAGACGTQSSTSCGLFQCGATACLTICGTDTDCVASAFCSAGACVPKLTLGALCAGANACQSGNCVDGVCCNTACNGTCQTCNQVGSVGTCSNVLLGEPDVSTCVSPNKCDGGGACVECLGPSECTSKVCSGGKCMTPTCTDGVQNGDETAVDCGGTLCAACPAVALLGGSAGETFGAIYDLNAHTWSAASFGPGTQNRQAFAFLADGTGLGVTRVTGTDALKFTKLDPATHAFATFADVGAGLTARDAPSLDVSGTVAHLAYQQADYKFAYVPFSAGAFGAAEPVGTVASQSYGPIAGAVTGSSSIATFVFFDGGSSNNLYARDRSGGTWAAPTLLGSGPAYDTQPSIVTLSSGDRLVAFRGTDTRVYWTRRTAGTWSTPTSIASVFTNDPFGLAALDTDGALLAFRGTDGNLYGVFYAATAWGSVSQITTTITGVPSVARGRAPSIAELAFVNTEDGAAYHVRYASSAWTTPQSIGGANVTSVAIAAR